MKKIKFKTPVLISLLLSLLLLPSLPCFAEQNSEITLMSDDVLEDNKLFLNAYYDSESCKVFSEICVYTDETMPEIFCSYDNENFVLTEASEDNKFSFVPDENFSEVYVKAVQTLDDGTVYKSKTELVIIESIAPLSVDTCSDHDDYLGYIPDEHLGEAITIIPRSFGYMIYQYPDGSYYSNTGIACTCHNYCKWYSPGDCIVFDEAIQCMGFAYEVYYEAHNKHVKKVGTTSYEDKLTADKAKSLFAGKDGEILCTYLRVATKKGYSDSDIDHRYDHSLIIAYTDRNKVVVYDANYGEPCKIRYQGYTWETFVEAFPYLYNYAKK